MSATEHTCFVKARCYRCGQWIEVGTRMVTTIERLNGHVILAHAHDCATPTQPEHIFGTARPSKGTA